MRASDGARAGSVVRTLSNRRAGRSRRDGDRLQGVSGRSQPLRGDQGAAYGAGGRPAVHDRFTQEALAVASLRHPNILTVYATATPKPLQPLAAAVKVTALDTGARVTLSTIVDPPLYRLYVDGSPVTEVRDDRTDSIPNIAFAAFGRSGSVTLTAVRVFATSG
jgi:hypothetical protein